MLQADLLRNYHKLILNNKNLFTVYKSISLYINPLLFR